jgi:hypothetical protein
VAGSREHGNEPSGFITGGEFLKYLNNMELLKKGAAPRSQLFRWISGFKGVVNL